MYYDFYRIQCYTLYRTKHGYQHLKNNKLLAKRIV